MGTLFKIARGSKASLPEQITDGIFYLITEPGSNSGELYGDIGNRRIKFGGGAEAKRAAEWGEETSSIGTFYIVSDAYGENKPGLKIGNGVDSVADLPVVTVSNEQIESWNHKVTTVAPSEANAGYFDPEDIESGKIILTENLIFTQN